MIRVLVIGAQGKMGRTVCDAVMAEDDMSLSAAIDTAFAGKDIREAFGLDIPLHDTLADCLGSGDFDVAVDFTTPDSVYENTVTCLEQGVHCVVGTTGITDDQMTDLENLAGQGEANCFLAPNFAIGAVLMMEAAMVISRYMPDCEIIEQHHDQKLDAPSGTSLRTAEMIADARKAEPEPAGPKGNPARGMTLRDIHIHSVRLPGLVAHQEVIFGGQGQTLKLRHDSISRESFMPGVVHSVRSVPNLDGLVVGLEKIL